MSGWQVCSASTLGFHDDMFGFSLAQECGGWHKGLVSASWQVWLMFDGASEVSGICAASSLSCWMEGILALQHISIRW